MIKAVGVGNKLPPLSRKADFVLFEAQSDERGASGELFDGDILKNYNGPPFILAGGLSAQNVVRGIKTLSPLGVDVSSGVETCGIKDADKMREFMLAVRGAKR